MSEPENVSEVPLDVENPLVAAEVLFAKYATEFHETDLVDRGRSLQSRKRINAMKVHLSPMESRLEQMVRALVGQVSALSARVRLLEDPSYQRSQGGVNISQGQELVERPPTDAEAALLRHLETAGPDPLGVASSPEATHVGAEPEPEDR